MSSSNTIKYKTQVQNVICKMKKKQKVHEIQSLRISNIITDISNNKKVTFHPKMRSEDVIEIKKLLEEHNVDARLYETDAENSDDIVANVNNDSGVDIDVNTTEIENIYDDDNLYN